MRTIKRLVHPDFESSKDIIECFKNHPHCQYKHQQPMVVMPPPVKFDAKKFIEIFFDYLGEFRPINEQSLSYICLLGRNLFLFMMP